MKKFKLIKKITKFHPAAGVDYGLSTYTGGMKDSGYWFEGRLLSLKKKALKKLLNSLSKRESFNNKPVENTNTTVIQWDGNLWYFQSEFETHKKFEEGLERYWFGTDKFNKK